MDAKTMALLARIERLQRDLEEIKEVLLMEASAPVRLEGLLAGLEVGEAELERAKQSLFGGLAHDAP